MGTKQYKPTSPAIRNRKTLDYEEITSTEPEKSLLLVLNKKAGRNNSGRITVRSRGGGVKRLYRKVDFKRDKHDISGKIKTIEYDPNRTSNISLVQYADGEKRYIISPNKAKPGDKVLAGSKADVKIGNTLKLSDIPTGSIIHNVELTIGKGGQVARSAGTKAVLMAKSKKYATVKMPSGEVRLINVDCKATIGEVGNAEKRNTQRGRAGSTRWAGRRPKVRGSVMNPCDHPHGGGEGRAPIGLAGPRSPWGKPTLGYKTRNKKKKSTKFIVKRRK